MDMDETQQWYRQHASREQLLEEVDNQHELYLRAQQDIQYYRAALMDVLRSAQQWRWNHPNVEDQEAFEMTLKEIREKVNETLTQRHRKFE